MKDNTELSQRIEGVPGGCFYQLSFFARGEGAQVGLTARVTFVTPTQQITGGTLTIRQQDMPNSNRDFAFYKINTSAAPANTTAVIITFVVDASGQQSMDLDDVSFTNL